MRRTKEDAAETARQILQAAESLFLEKGYEKVSLEEIAVAVGVTRGAIHWHFKNKQGLLLAIRDRGKEPYRKLAAELSNNTAVSVLTKINDIVSELFERLENDPRQRGLIRCMMRLDISLTESDGICGATFRRELHQTFIQIFSAVEEEVRLTAPWHAESAASVFSATIVGLLSDWALEHSTVRLSPDGQALVKMILSGLISEACCQKNSRPED